MANNDYSYDEGYTPENTTHRAYRPDLAIDRTASRSDRRRRTAGAREPMEQVEATRSMPAPKPAETPKPTEAPATIKSQGAAAGAATREAPAPKPAQEPIAVRTEPARTSGSAPEAGTPGRTPSPADILGRIKRLIDDKRVHMFLSFALFCLATFIIIAVISYFQYGGEDQSVVTNLTMDEAVGQNVDVHNAEGKFGAWLAHYLIAETLGLGSLALVAYLLVLSCKLFGKFRNMSFWGLTFRCLLLGITTSIVLGLVTYNVGTMVNWGGNHGHYVNKFLIDYTSIFGAILVSALLLWAVGCAYYNPLRKAYGVAKDFVVDKIDKIRRDRDRKIALAGEEKKEDCPIADDKTDTAAAGTAIPEIITVGPPIGSATASDEQSEAIFEPILSIDPDDSSKEANRETEIDETIFELDGVLGNDETEDGDTEGEDFEIELDNGFTVKSSEIEEGDGVPNPGKLYDPRADLSRYRFPTLDLLEDRPSGPVIDMEEQEANKHRIEETLKQYGIGISHIDATVGPTVTLYEIVPAEGVRISQIKRLEDDIALSLSAIGIRIIAPIPGKGTVGIEVPNNDPKTVSMYSVINSRKYQETKMALPMAMGATISNDVFIADLAKMPHLLVAGATGMGKSVGLNVIISSLLYKKHPSELKLVLVDPKMVEFSLYSRLERHFLAKLPNEDDAIITDMRKVVETLNSLCIEMDNRYELLRNANVRSLEEYNKKFVERRLNPEKGHKYLPYIVVVVDEFADLIMTQGKEVETPIARIAQKARAVGIHMILATQRPSTNVITGLIKANFPGRIAFRVIQMVDSRTILDCPGANQLIGRGDMLFSHNGSMERVQCAFMSTEEVESLVQYVDDQVGYEHAYYLPEYVPPEAEGSIAGASMERDALFNEAARFVVTRQIGSTSSLQRQFSIGYSRAGKLMDQLEAAGVVGPVNGSKPRNILMDLITLESILGED